MPWGRLQELSMLSVNVLYLLFKSLSYFSNAILVFDQTNSVRVFPGGPVVENRPSHAGNEGLNLGQERFHLSWGN